MSSRVERALSRAAGDRQVKLAAASVAAAGAAVAGKAGLDRLRGAGEGEEAPSRAYRLDAGEKTRQGLARIASGRIESATENLSAAADGDAATAIHEARKDLKKLRALLRLVRRGVGEERYRVENARYRDAGRSLSGARDAEVMLETLTALERRYEEKLPEDSIAGFRKHLEKQRSAAVPDLEAATALLAEGRVTVGDWAAQKGGWRLLEPALRRTYRRGRRLMKRSRTKPTAENVHEWRKRTKDLWYQLRILSGAWPGPIGEAADQSHYLSELLGDHHDLAVLRAEAQASREQFERPRDRKRLVGLIDAREDELLAAALDVGRRLYAEKPKAFTKRIGAYWAAWRGG